MAVARLFVETLCYKQLSGGGGGGWGIMARNDRNTRNEHSSGEICFYNTD